jgi:hypothetical protein
MSDLLSVTLSIVAIGISLISIIFVLITQGSKETIGYRGSEETRNRKNRIDSNLAKQVQSEVEKFISSCTSGKISKPELHEQIQNLGGDVYVSKNLVTDILDTLTYSIEKGILFLSMGLAIAVATALVIITLDVSNVFSIFLVIAYGILSAYCLRRGIKHLRLNYELKSKFILLDENPTMEYASDLFEELTARNII